MRVLELWRHPVKSLQGERLEEAAIVPDGLAGDREWGIRDKATGNVLTGRREPLLLLASSRLLADGRPEMTLPDGRRLTGATAETDAVLSDWLGRNVALVPCNEPGRRVAEVFADATDDTSPAFEFTLADGHFVDTFPLLLLTTASLRQGAREHPAGVWDVRRFRPNVLIDVDGTGWVEDDWSGKRVRVGDVALDAQARCERCTMVTRPQPGLERDLDVYRTLARGHSATFGVWSSVQTPGVVRVGDDVVV